MKKKSMHAHKYEMTIEKAKDMLQLFENNGNNLERFDLKLDRVLEPIVVTNPSENKK